MKIENNKLLLIITDYGSFNNFLSELSSQILKIGNYDIHVICSKDKIINTKSKFNFIDKPINFHFVDIPRSFNIFKQASSSFKINRLINKIDPKVIHIHFTTAIFTTLLFSFKTKKHIFIGTFHGLNSVASSGTKKYLFKLIEMFCFFKLNKIFLINSVDFLSISPLFSHKIQLLKSKGLGCDLDLFNSDNFASSRRKSLKNNLKIKDEFVMTFIGRFVDFKGFDIAIKSFLKLSDNHKNNIKLILIGGFDSVHKSGLTDLEEKFILNHENIINIGYTHDVYNYLPVIDLLLFPSKKEGLPIVVTESLAMAVPVISFDSRGTNELIINEFNGILIKENINSKLEIDFFVDSISGLLNDTTKLNLMKKNAILNRNILSRQNFVNNEIDMYNKYFLNSIN